MKKLISILTLGIALVPAATAIIITNTTPICVVDCSSLSFGGDVIILPKTNTTIVLTNIALPKAAAEINYAFSSALPAPPAVVETFPTGAQQIRLIVSQPTNALFAVTLANNYALLEGLGGTNWYGTNTALEVACRTNSGAVIALAATNSPGTNINIFRYRTNIHPGYVWGF